MNSVREIARSTRRGLFGNRIPARAWNTAIGNFQDAREKLSRALLDLEALPPSTEDLADAQAWEATRASLSRQMSVMDSTAATLLTGANIANGIDMLLPGFEGVTAANVLGLDRVAGPAAIATLAAMTRAAHSIVTRADRLLGKPSGLAGLAASASTFTPWETYARPGLAGFTPWGSIGGDVWEWLHAEQVQQEYIAVGQEPPSIEEIKEGALFDIGERVSEKASAFVNYSKTIIVAGAVIAAVVLLGGRK